MRKLLSGILIITLCSCGTSFKALEQKTTKSEKYSFRDYVVAVDSIWNKYSTRTTLIDIALYDSLNKSPKRSERNIIKYFDTIYAKEFSEEIEDWEQRPLELRFFGRASTFMDKLASRNKTSSWRKAMVNAMDKVRIDANDKYNYEEGISIWKRRKQLKSNKEFMKGANLADSVSGIISKKRDFSKKERANTLRKYLDLRERYPLREQTDMFIYGYWFTTTVYIRFTPWVQITVPNDLFFYITD